LPFWVTARAIWGIVLVAFALACSPGLPVLAPLAAVLGALLALAAAIDAFVLPRPARVHIRRVLPEHLALRRTKSIRYEIENTSTQTLRVGVAEQPVRTLEVADDDAWTPVPARSRAALDVAVTPVARGSDTFTRIFAWYETPLRLVRRRFAFDAELPFRVYPDLSAVERYGKLNVRNRLIEAGLRRMRLRGEGTEFESVRDYAPGDAFRAIDWKATARRGKVMVVQREVERSQDVMLLLDCGRLMTARVGEQRKLDYAVTAALSLATIASLASDRVGVVAFAREILVARSPRSTVESIGALANALCDVEARFEESDYAHAFAYIRSHVHRRSLIVLFTDVIDPVAQSMVLAELRSLTRRHVVLCVFMNDAAVAQTIGAAPERVAQAYALGVALGLEQERALAARTLQRCGVVPIDVPAAKLSVATIDEYLRIKARGML
jgi:uncharacterized protein (DUF58 family)